MNINFLNLCTADQQDGSCEPSASPPQSCRSMYVIDIVFLANKLSFSFTISHNDHECIAITKISNILVVFGGENQMQKHDK